MLEIKEKRANNFKDLTGQRFGRLLVIKYIGKDKHDCSIWLCRCDCGNEKIIRIDSLTSGRSKSCRCYNSERTRETQSKFIGDLSGTFWARIRAGAKSRNLSFDINQQYAWDLFIKQQKKCALSGRILSFGKRVYERKKNIQGKYIGLTASLDRIDSSKGYIEGNVQWVHKDINMAKQSLSHEDFIQLCKDVAKHSA